MSPRLRVWLVVGAAGVRGRGDRRRRDARHAVRRRPADVEGAAVRPRPDGAAGDREPTSGRRSRPGRRERRARLRILAERYPRSALVRLELGLALAFTGQNADAVARVAGGRARAARLPVGGARAGPPPSGHAAGPAAVRPELHATRRLVAQRHLLAGRAFQQALRPVSAEREFAAAARSGAEQPRSPDRGRRRPLRQGPARRSRSRGSAPSRGASRTPRRSASTSGSC